MRCWVVQATLLIAVLASPAANQVLFRCSGSNQEIPLDWVCNGQNDCADGSDELNCACGTDRFQCGSGGCISQLWECDGNLDCEDGSDEQDCYEAPTNTTCHSYQFTCDNGDCVHDFYVCDGDFDCSDESDEKSCSESSNCTELQFTCANGECIPENWQCDTENDCSDASDEEECIEFIFDCGTGLFNCTVGDVCIPIDRVCNSQSDCPDNSDEEDCPYNTACSDHEFQCADPTLGCINRDWVCDGEGDCEDDSDEIGCEGVCYSYQFECTTGGCANISSRCDGVPDCRDGSDEFVCQYPPPRVECQAIQYSCLDGQLCIDPSLVCNGSPQCLDDSDELPQLCSPVTRSCTTDNGGCEHNCLEVSGGHVICTCRHGYLLNDDLASCSDIDECQYPYTCPQHCINTAGGYNCSCDPGYSSHDIKGCKAATGPSAYLILSNHADIRSYPLHPQEDAKILVNNLVNCLALDYHYQLGYMFWTDVSEDVIKRAQLDGSHVTTVISQDLDTPGGLAVDWVNNKLYWTDSGTSRIEVSDIDGTNRTILFSTDLSAPRAIVVDPEKGYLFWTDWGESPRIERSSMDGKSRTVLHDVHIVWPNALTADYVTKAIYWADARLQIIETSFYDGSARRPVISQGVRHAFAITLFENSVYWTEWETRSIFSTDKGIGNYVYLKEDGTTEPQNVKSIGSDLFKPRDIHVVHPLRQKIVNNSCSIGNGGCEYLCLLSADSPDGYTCACPPGIELADDGRGCKPLNTFLLFCNRVDIRRVSLDTEILVDIKLPITGLSTAMALDWDHITGLLFWTDILNNTIGASNLDGTGQTVLLSNNLNTPAGLAVDWLTQKLYWTDDTDYDRIEVADYDGSNRSVLIVGNMERPRDIIVHPAAGLMFWTDWGQYPRIERANLDGSGRVAIVSNDLLYPNGLAIDYEEGRLYWCDGDGHIEYCDFNGENRVSVVNSSFYHPFGLALHEEWLYWTDWESDSIHRTHKITGAEITNVITGLGNPNDIHIYHRNRTSVEHPCHDNNGGCSHLCLGKAGPEGVGLLASCACPTGYSLLDDGLNCKSYIDNYLLFSTGSQLRQISLDLEQLANVILPISHVWAASSVGVDIVDNYYYWANPAVSKIFRAPIAGGEPEVVVERNIRKPESLAIDWIGRNLYWCDAELGKIEVVQLASKSSYVLFDSDLHYVSSIAVDLKSHEMFWLDTGNLDNNKPPKLEMAKADGSERETLVSQGMMQPRELATDNYSGLGARICWTDSLKKTIECVGYRGEGRTVVLEFPEESGAAPLGIAVWGEYLYWTDTTRNSLLRAMKADGSQLLEIVSDLPAVQEITLVSKADLARQESFAHGCDHPTQHCSEICLQTIDTFLYTCVCPTGLQLLGDGFSCKTEPDQYILVAATTTIERISLDFQSENEFRSVTLISGLSGVTALDYLFTAPNEGLVIYGDSYRNALYSAHLNGTGERRITELGQTDGIAVDWVNHNVYWTDHERDELGVVSLTSGHRKILNITGVENPRAIAVDPGTGLLFWTDLDTSTLIRARMDGTGRTVIVKPVHDGNGLDLDRTKRRVYWVDLLFKQMKSCNYDGGDQLTIFEQLKTPFSMSLFRGFMFWSDWDGNHIRQLRVDEEAARLQDESALPQDVSLLEMKGTKPLSIAVVSAQETRQGELEPEGPCTVNNGGCAFLCLPHDANTRSCVCPDDSPGCVHTIITEPADSTPTAPPTTQPTTSEETTQPTTPTTGPPTTQEPPTLDDAQNFPGTTEGTPAPFLTFNNLFILVFGLIILVLLIAIAITTCLIVNWLRRSRTPKPSARLEATNPHYCHSKVRGPAPLTKLTDDNQLNSKPDKVIGNLLPKKYNDDPQRNPPSPISANIFRPDRSVPEPARRKRPTRLDSCTRPLIASESSPSPPLSAKHINKVPLTSLTPAPPTAHSPKQINVAVKPGDKVVRFDASIPAEEQPPPLPVRGVPPETGTVPRKSRDTEEVVVSIEKPLLVPSPDTTSLESETSC